MKFIKNGWFILVVIIGLSAGGYWYYQKKHEPLPGEEFKTVSVDRGDMQQSVTANGTINPVTLVSVGTQVSGTVKQLHADFNDHVKAGQILLELDDALFTAQMRQSEANIRNAQASLDLARANESRMQNLFSQEYVSRQEYDQSIQARKSAEAQIGLYQAQLARDRANLNYSVIRSPVSGVVVARKVDLGQTVAASFQTPELFTIAQDLSKMVIHANFAEADVGLIRVGQQAHFSVDAFPSKTFPAVVGQVRLNPTTQSNVVTYDVVLTVDNPDNILLPGMTAYVNVILAEKQAALRISNAALRYRPSAEVLADSKVTAVEANKSKHLENGQRSIYVLRAGKMLAVPVTLGISDNKFTEVTGGELSEGDKIITGDNVVKSSKPRMGQPF